jgi:Putative amidase domain
VWDSPAPVFVGNGMTSHCIFVRDYVMAAGVSVVAANCSGNDAERWIPEKTGTLYRLHPYYSNGLCLDIDNYDGSTNTLTPADGARAQVYTCSGSSNQSFNIVQQTVGYWKIQPQTGGTKCLDEDLNVVNNTGSISYFVQHFTCTGQTNQFWFPLANKDLPQPCSNGSCQWLPTNGQGVIKTLANNCLYSTGGIGVLAYGLAVSASDCTGTDELYWTSELVAAPAPGYRLHPYSELQMCLRNVGGQAAVAACSGGTDDIWIDAPFMYPNATFRLQSSSQPSQCLTLQSATSIVLTNCSSSNPAQIWTDPIKCSGALFWKSCAYSLPTSIASPTSNRNVAAKYAYQWVNGTNLTYSQTGIAPFFQHRAWGQYGNDPAKEDDCTNFASQALHEGGLAYTNAWRYDTTTRTSSGSWRNTDALPANLLANNRVDPYVAIPLGQKNFGLTVSAGDLFAMDFDGDGSIDHQSVVVEGGSIAKNVFVAYHTNDVFSSVDVLFGKLKGGPAKFYWYHVKYPDGL